MFHGTTIDELLNIVVRAEEHARTETAAVEAKPVETLPGFLYEMQKQQQVWYGVA